MAPKSKVSGIKAELQLLGDMFVATPLNQRRVFLTFRLFGVLAGLLVVLFFHPLK